MLVALSTLLLACGEPTAASGGSTEEVAKGTREDVGLDVLETAIADGALVIDVRTDNEWNAGHVPGAKHAPLQGFSPSHALLKDHDKTKPVYLVCQSGGRSGRAADLLAAAGFHAVNIKGGTGAWQAAGKPIETP